MIDWDLSWTQSVNTVNHWVPKKVTKILTSSVATSFSSMMLFHAVSELQIKYL